MKSTFTVDGRLIGVNDIINVARTNRYGSAAQKKKEMRKVGFAIMAGNVPHFKGPVSITFDFFEPNRKRDPDNISGGAHKVVLDSLVELGRLPNDTQEFVKSITDHFHVDRERPRVEIQIEEIGEKK